MFEVKITANLDDLQTLAAQFPEASEQARVAKITESLMLLDREVVKRTPYGAGPIHLRSAFTTKTVVRGQKVIGILGNPLAHGEPVELGTKPHFPPTAPIQFWVEKKLGYSGKEAASVAFLIARAISKRGTKGARMVQKSFDLLRPAIIEILNEIPDDIKRRVGL